MLKSKKFFPDKKKQSEQEEHETEIISMVLPVETKEEEIKEETVDNEARKEER